MIGYPNGQDRNVLLARDYPLYPLGKKYPEGHIINSLLAFIGSVKMAGYWRRSFFLQVYGPGFRLGP